MKRSGHSTRRQYPRMARVNALLREIIGEELERVDSDELTLITVTGVDCSPDLRLATVYYDGPGGPEADDDVIEAFEEYRRGIQHAIGAQARLKNTPELRFVPDPAVREGEHIDRVLREVVHSEAEFRGEPPA